MKLGFIGAGNMGSAILKGALDHQFLSNDDLMIFDINQELCTSLSEVYNVHVASTAQELAVCSEWILLAVKPVFLKEVLHEIKPVLKNQKIISIAAGWSMNMLQREVGDTGATILRVMPNTPALVGSGMTVLCEENTLNPEDFLWAKQLFSTLGEAEVLPERLFDAVIAVSGSSPAYVFMFIEAMADAAVRLGMPRKTAILSAAQAVFGAAKMVLQTGEHPAVLKDQVCSPGGTTIEAVQVLETNGFRASVMQAMAACAEKSKKMTKQ